MGLSEFIQSRTQPDIVAEEQKKNEIIASFRENVLNLYDTITNIWFKPLIDDRQMFIKRNKVSITEDKLGTYDIDTLELSFINQTIEFRPKGTKMLGTDARVDMYFHDTARQMIVRAKEKMTSPMQMVNICVNGEPSRSKQNLGKMEWKLVSIDDRMRLETLTKESLEKIIVDMVSNG